MPLSPPQQVLYDLMSDVSELHWFARWMSLTEFRLWHFVVDPTDNGDWGNYQLEPGLRAQLSELSTALDGWITWSENDGGPLFVPLEAWLVSYNVWQSGQLEARERPRRYVDYLDYHKRVKDDDAPPED